MRSAHSVALRPVMQVRSICASTDEALIEAVAAGDKSALRTLYERHNVRVYRYIVRLVADAHLAEDILSEVFFEVWRQAKRFEMKAKVSTWILAIARYRSWSARRTRRESELDMASAEQIEVAADNPEEAALKTDRVRQLSGCIRQLSFGDREIIDLVYYHGKTIAEVAEVICVPPNTVKTRMFYARKRLAKLLAGHVDFWNCGRYEATNKDVSGCPAALQEHCQWRPGD